MKISCKGQRTKSFLDKYLALAISMLLFFGAKAQTITYTPMTAAGYQFKYFKSDSGHALPFIDTTLGRGTTRPGSIVCSIRDSLLYYWNGRKFLSIIGSGGSIFLGLDSITVSGNNLCQWKGGVPKCYLLNGGGNTFLGIDSLTYSGNSICWWKGGAPTCYSLLPGVDSVTVNGNQLCEWTGGNPICYTITGNVLGTGIDSVTVNGNTLCQWTGGVSTCYTINSISHGVDSLATRNDSLFYYIAGVEIFSGFSTGDPLSTFIGSFCGAPTITPSGPAIALDSCNNRLYFYNPHIPAWDYAGHSPGGSFVDSVTRSADTVYYWIAGAAYFGFQVPNATDTVLINNIVTTIIHDSLVTHTDTSSIVNHGALGTSLGWGDHVTDSIHLKKIYFRNNLTVTQNPDSSITVDASASGTGGISKLGSPTFGLTRVNDSTYVWDTAQAKNWFYNKTSVDSGLALKQPNITLTTTGTSGASTLIGATLNIPQYTGGGGSTVKDSVTEQKRYYNQEFYWNHGINTTTGAFTSDATLDISDYIPIEGSTSTVITTTDSSLITIYGWTYDSTLTPISEIRSNTLIGTKLKTYTFTTPSNARYIAVYTKAASDSFYNRLRINSTATITYAVPITPEQFTGTSQTAKIQNALNFARWTSNGVELKGDYFLDSAMILSSGNTLILKNAKVQMKYGMHDNMVRNEAVAEPASHIFNRGNKNIKIIGIGNAEFRGSTEAWGGDNQTGLGAETWRLANTRFANVENFEINGITIRAPNQWGFIFEQSRIGMFKNNTLLAAGEHLNQTLVQVHRGSHGIVIEDNKGQNMVDDIIALENLKYHDSMYILKSIIYEPYRKNLDIYDIFIRNTIRTNGRLETHFTSGAPAFTGRIRLITSDSLKMHDILIDGVDRYQEVLVQDAGTGYVVSTPPSVDDMYNIQVSNAYCPVYVFQPIKNSSFINIPPTDTSGLYLTVKPPNGSLNIYRKYQNAAPEFIDSVFGGVEYISLKSPILAGGNSSAGSLTLTSTTNVTKGLIKFGTSAYDEVNNRLGIGTYSPSFSIHLNKTTNGAERIAVTNSSSGISAESVFNLNNGTNGATFKIEGTGYSPFGLSIAQAVSLINNGGSRLLISSAPGSNFVKPPIIFGVGANGDVEAARIFYNTSFSIGSATDSSAKLVVAGTEKVTDSLGVGVYPTKKLDVNGDIQIASGSGLYMPQTTGTNRSFKFFNSNVTDNFASMVAQPSAGTNVTMSMNVMPKGTGRSSTEKSQVIFYNTDFVADATNYEFAKIKAAGTDGYGFMNGNAGTGTLRPLFIDATGGQSFATGNMQFRTDGGITVLATNTATGTTGARTINKPSGTVNIAAAGTSVVVTNSLITTSSIIFAIVRTADANKTKVYAVVPAAGSCTINVDPAPAAEISIGWWTIN